MTELNLKDKIQGEILIVDDEPAILELYKLTLDMEGISAIYAVDGKEGWNIFQNNPQISIVITDIVMPEMTGVELMQKILKSRPSVQIIVITGHLDDALALNSVRKNVVCLPKPVFPKFVLAALAAASARQRYTAWEEKLKVATQKSTWDVEYLLNLLQGAPWLEQNVRH